MKNEQYIVRMKACIKRVEESESVEEQYFAAGFLESLLCAAVDDKEISSDEFDVYIGLRTELLDLLRRLHEGDCSYYLHSAVKLEGEWEK